MLVVPLEVVGEIEVRSLRARKGVPQQPACFPTGSERSPRLIHSLRPSLSEAIPNVLSNIGQVPVATRLDAKLGDADAVKRLHRCHLGPRRRQHPKPRRELLKFVCQQLGNGLAPHFERLVQRVHHKQQRPIGRVGRRDLPERGEHTLVEAARRIRTLPLG